MTHFVRALAIIVLMLTLVQPHAQAETLTYDFQGVFDSGEPFSGTFSYDTEGNPFGQSTTSTLILGGTPQTQPSFFGPAPAAPGELGLGPSGSQFPQWFLNLIFESPTPSLDAPLPLDTLIGLSFFVFEAEGLPISFGRELTVALSSPLPEPFAALDIVRARAYLRESHADRFRVKGYFTLGATSDGVDVLNEDVTVTFDLFTQTIPAGAFFRDDDDDDDDGGFQFRSDQDGIRRITIRDDGMFYVKARDVDLSGIDLESPVPFSLQIGNDLGETDIPFNDNGRLDP